MKEYHVGKYPGNRKAWQVAEPRGTGAGYLQQPLFFGDAGEPDFRFVDLFAGIGGIRMAFETIGGRCVFTSEWNEWAKKTYLANFDETGLFAGDITEVDAGMIPDHDVLLAGFPCQPFSIAGVSKKNALGRPHGFADKTQGTLFFDVKRILAEKRPAAFLLENVKNLVRHDKGRTFEIIMETLRDELGYKVVQSRIIDARHFVPQHRERIYIAGFRDKVDFDLDSLDIGSHQDPVLESILHPQNGSEKPLFPYTEGVKGRVSARYTLSDHLWGYLQAYKEKHQQKGNGFGFGLFGPSDVARTLSARYHKDGSEILIKQKGKAPRRLTPRECARLMGYPDDFIIPVSDTQAYRQFGNSVVVPVLVAIAHHMKPALDNVLKKVSNRELVGGRCC